MKAYKTVYTVTSNRGYIKVFANKEKAERVAKEEQSYANMRGDRESFYVDKVVVDEGN